MNVLLISAINEAAAETPLPFGLACVAAATEKAGHNVQLLVLNSRPDWQSVLQKAIEQLRPDIIGISIRNIDDQNVQSPCFLVKRPSEVVAEIRSISHAPIVVGGAGYSIFPDAALKYLRADMGIQGEGEIAFPALLSQIEQGTQGIAVSALHMPEMPATARDFAWNLDALPLPEPRLWLDSALSSETRVPVQSRRGCPLDCIYCSTSAIEGKPLRRRSPEVIVSWLARLRECGFRHFYFVDNTFNLPLPYAKELCMNIVKAKLDLDWSSIIYPKWVDAELVELMAKAGCTQVSLGFESGSEPMLLQLHKRFTRAEVQSISGAFAAAGIKRHGFLLLGGPGETRETVEQSLAFAESLGLDGLKITVGVRIYPHTTLASIARAEGVISSDDDLLWPRFYLTRALRDWLPDRIAHAGMS